MILQVAIKFIPQVTLLLSITYYVIRVLIPVSARCKTMVCGRWHAENMV